MAGRADSISVFLKLYGAKNFSREVLASGAELEAMGLKGAKGMARFAASGARLKSFGRSWTRNVSLPVAGLGIVAAKMALGFGRQMSLISSQAGGTVGEVEHLKGSVLELAHHSKFGPEELAKSLFFIESAGKRGSAAMRLLNANVKLATTGNSDLEHTTFGTVGAMNALGKEGKNFNRIAAIMNATVGHGHMRMEELVAALGTGIVGAGKSFGASFKGINSAIAFFTRLGEPAQQAATRLRMTLTHLATSSTTKGAEALTSIGMSAEKMGASIRKTGTIGPVIKELAAHLKSIPQGRANQVISEAFGGGRYGTQIREATQQVGLFLKTEREIGKSGTIRELNKGFGIAKNAGLVKMEEAWSSIKASVTELGESFLPAIVPLFAKVATIAKSILGSFSSLSPNMMAVTAGFLLLTGPILSGLGYFAGGLGKILVLTNKVGKGVVAFQTALAGEEGLRGALGAASKEAGMSGALQTAKGFAYSLGPALALYGVGNIITSVISGNGKDAAFEAGGALAGGIAGGIAGSIIPGVGTAIGAMAGVGIGSLGGELLSGLFGSTKELGPLQAKVASSGNALAAALRSEQKAGEGLSSSTKRLTTTRGRAHRATNALKVAQEHLAEVVAAYGPHSRPALKAELRLTRAIGHHRQALKKLKQAERLHGTELSAYKTVTDNTILTERHRTGVLKALAARQSTLYREEKRLHPGSEKTLQLAKNLEGTLHNLRKARTDEANTLKEAAAKGGAKYAKFLETAKRQALEFGSAAKWAAEKAASLSLFKHETPGGMFPEPGEPRHHPHHHGPQPRHRKTANTVPRPRVKKLMAGGLGGALNVAVENVNMLMLDGKEVANNTTHHVAHAAGRA